MSAAASRRGSMGGGFKSCRCGCSGGLATSSSLPTGRERAPMHLVTGGAGFIGINLIERLLSRGEAVIALDNLVRGHEASLGRFEGRAGFRCEQVGCADLAALRRFLDGIGPAGAI